MDSITFFYVGNVGLAGLIGVSLGIVVKELRRSTSRGWVAEMPYTVPGAVLGMALGATAAWLGTEVIQPQSDLFAEPQVVQPERRLPSLIGDAVAQPRPQEPSAPE